mgnify:FL=1
MEETVEENVKNYMYKKFKENEENTKKISSSFGYSFLTTSLILLFIIYFIIFIYLLPKYYKDDKTTKMSQFIRFMKKSSIGLLILISIFAFSFLSGYSFLITLLVLSFVTFFSFFIFILPMYYPGSVDIIKMKKASIGLLSLFLLVFFIVSIVFLAINHEMVAWVMLILNFIFVIGGLALFYKYFKLHKYKDDKDATSSIGLSLLKNIIFYIPCLLLNFIDYIKYQYKITTRPIWILFFVEIVVIILRLLIPFLYKKYGHRDGKVLLDKPVYLNNETDLGIFQNIDPTTINKDSLDKESPYKYNYAVSCWIWINSNSTSTSSAYNKSTTLLNYGDVIQINMNKNKIEILALTSDNNLENMNKLVSIYEDKEILYQKWNNFIINYSGGTLDIFINNKLVASRPNITPIMSYSKITAGFPNGVYGGIKDIVYYDKVLSRNKIHSIYNSYF